MSELAKALTAAQKNFKPVPKTKTGQVGNNRKYKYAGLDDILGMAVPVLNAEGVFFSQTFKRDGNDLCLITRLVKGTDVLEDAGLPIPLALSNQELGMRLTYLRRYSASAILGIATEDDTDGVPQAAEDPSRSGQEVKRSTPIIHQPNTGVTITNAVPVRISPETGKFIASESDVPSNIGDPPNKTEMASIKEALKGLGIDNDRLKSYSLKYSKVAAVKDITRTQWSEIISNLKQAQSDGTIQSLVA